MGGRSNDMSVFNRIIQQSGSNQTCRMSHIDHQDSSYFICDFAHTFVVPFARIGRGAADDNGVAHAAEIIEGLGDRLVPVMPRRKARDVGPEGQTWNDRAVNRHTLARKRVGYRFHLERRAAQRMNQQYPRGSARNEETAASRLKFLFICHWLLALAEDQPNALYDAASQDANATMCRATVNFKGNPGRPAVKIWFANLLRSL